jgi:hypothetical protein
MTNDSCKNSPLKSGSLSLLAALSFVTVTACGGSDHPTGSGSDTSGTPAAGDGTQSNFPKALLPKALVADLPLVAPTSDLDIPVFSGIVDVGPGGDSTFCTFTDVVLTEATIFGESYGAESPGGHHAILQYTTTPQAPHTGDCGAMDGQMLLGGSGGKTVADKPTLPTNYGVEVPAGAQLVINHHWINSSEKAIKGQAMMLARRLPRGGDTILGGNLPMLGLGWEIPPQGELSYSTKCTYAEDVPYILALGHMHEFGQHVNIDVDRVDGTSESLIDEVWTPDKGTTTSGAKIFSLDDPFVIKKGDTVTLKCDWSNSSANAISFPREMCIFFGYTVGASYVCANGSWMSSQAAYAAGMGSTDIAQHL